MPEHESCVDSHERSSSRFCLSDKGTKDGVGHSLNEATTPSRRDAGFRLSNAGAIHHCCASITEPVQGCDPCSSLVEITARPPPLPRYEFGPEPRGLSHTGMHETDCALERETVSRTTCPGKRFRFRCRRLRPRDIHTTDTCDLLEWELGSRNTRSGRTRLPRLPAAYGRSCARSVRSLFLPRAIRQLVALRVELEVDLSSRDGNHLCS